MTHPAFWFGCVVVSSLVTSFAIAWNGPSRWDYPLGVLIGGSLGISLASWRIRIFFRRWQRMNDPRRNGGGS